MNTRILHKIIGLILAALLLTGILLLTSTTAAAQRRYHRRVLSQLSLAESQPTRQAQPVRPFSAFGPFGRSYHPFWDPYGRYDHYTFFRHSLSKHGRR